MRDNGFTAPWLYIGGAGLDSQGSTGYLSDLWHYDAGVAAAAAAADGDAGWLYLGGSMYAFGGGWLSAPWPRPRVFGVNWLDDAGRAWLWGGEINLAGWRLTDLWSV